jgi:hypothetical protein
MSRAPIGVSQGRDREMTWPACVSWSWIGRIDVPEGSRLSKYLDSTGGGAKRAHAAAPETGSRDSHGGRAESPAFLTRPIRGSTPAAESNGPPRRRQPLEDLIWSSPAVHEGFQFDQLFPGEDAHSLVYRGFLDGLHDVTIVTIRAQQ